VRDGAALRRAHSVQADYTPPLQQEDDLVDFCEISPELSRPFRGLRVWLPFKLYGAGPFRAALAEKLALARRATEELRTIPGIEILAEPQLSITAFRLRPPGAAEADLDDLNRLNRRFLARINQKNRVHLTATTLGGRFALRICVLSFRTHLDRIEACLEDLRAAALEVV
jgi:aromatic-L-amino-acid/L-tryptophan decarboxylase